MNRWIRRAAALSSLASALALFPAGVAVAGDSPQGQGQSDHRHLHRPGLMGAALKLDSLSQAQRASIEQLAQNQRQASIPVRHADAQVLTELAREVEQASIDPKALQPSLGAEQSAAAARTAVEKDALNQLHALLTPAQRSELVDAVEAAHAPRARRDAGTSDHGPGRLGLTADQRSAIHAKLVAERPGSGAPRGARRAALESFRGDAFDAAALVRVVVPGERAERMAEAMVPVLTAAQRATFAGDLRARAAREGA